MDKKLDRLADRILTLLKVRRATLDIFLLPHCKIARLKERFIKKKTEPDVLAFSEPAHFPHPETKKRYLGEIYLNHDILKRNPEHAAPLLLHGILHLLGYDHKTPISTKKMERRETKTLRQLETPLHF